MTDASRTSIGRDDPEHPDVIDIQDPPVAESVHRAELVDGPAAGGFRPIRLEGDVPPSELDVELDDGGHVVYIYFGRRGQTDPAAYAFGWDRQPAQPTPAS